MSSSRSRLIVLVLAGASGFGATAAFAQERIGQASAVLNQVTGRGGKLSSGDGVFRNEAISTQADSSAKLVFLDSTNLSIGPSARVVLDQYVYAGENSAGKVSVSLAKGAFRFVTGNSDKRAYEIKTPTATLGVRGTVFDSRISANETTATLVEGEVLACPRYPVTKRTDCVILRNAGDTVTITRNGIRFLGPASAASFSFAGYCGPNPALCTPEGFPGAPGTRFASQTAVGELCGR